MSKRIWTWIRTPLWLLLVAALTVLVWIAVDSVLGTSWVILPYLPDIPPAPFWASLTFLFYALLARPFHYWRPGVEYTAWGPIWVPKEARKLRQFIDPKRYIVLGIGNNRVMSETQGFWRKSWATFALLTLAVSLLLPAFKFVMLWKFDRDFQAVLTFKPPVSSIALSAPDEHGRKTRICVFTKEDREYVALKDVPEEVKNAFVAAEDKNFWKHDGVDILSIIRAARANNEVGRAKQGGSTISQQVVKQVVLKNSEKTLVRKIRELFLTVEMEKSVPKETVLEVYLNHIYLGRAYGVQAASQRYFGKDVKGLTLGEAAILAGMPPRPIANSPSHMSEEWRWRRKYVLGRMVEMDYITRARAADAEKQDIATVEHENPLNKTATPYFCEFLRREVEPVYGTETFFKGGLVIETTIDMRMQNAGSAAVKNGISDIERRLGFHGPEGRDESWKGVCVKGRGYVSDGSVEMATVSSVDTTAVKVCVDGEEFPFHPEDVARIRAWEARNGFGPDDLVAGSNGVALGKIKYGRFVVGDDGKAVGSIDAKGTLIALDGRVIGRVTRLKPRIQPGDRLSVHIESFEGTPVKDKAGKAVIENGKEKHVGVIGRYALSARRIGGADNPDVLQAAYMAVDPRNGELRALVGGFDFNENQWNHATQAARQTGSSIKPYIYAAGLGKGMKVTDVMVDGPACYPSSSGMWCPQNYSGPYTKNQYMGSVDLTTALAKSLNSISVKIAARVGTEEVIRTIRKVGITAPIVRNLPVAIGTPQVTLWEHTYGYAVFAANGRAMPVQCWQGTPKGTVCRKNRGVFVRRIMQGGVVLHETVAGPVEQALPAAVAYETLHLMRGVVAFGTGKRVQELRRPAAGKTGTTNDFVDAWFMGTTADVTAGVWVGKQRPSTIAEEATGGALALPIWMAAMKVGHPTTPPRDFPAPDDVVLTLKKGGKGSDPKKPELIPYRRGTAPF